MPSLAEMSTADHDSEDSQSLSHSAVHVASTQLQQPGSPETKHPEMQEKEDVQGLEAIFPPEMQNLPFSLETLGPVEAPWLLDVPAQGMLDTHMALDFGEEPEVSQFAPDELSSAPSSPLSSIADDIDDDDVSLVPLPALQVLEGESPASEPPDDSRVSKSESTDTTSQITPETNLSASSCIASSHNNEAHASHQHAPSTTTVCCPRSQTRPRTPLVHANSDEDLIQHDFQGSEGQQILRLKPTFSQWQDFPTLMKYARSNGAEKDGCFKVTIPDDWYGPIPANSPQEVQSKAYKVKRNSRNGFWKVETATFSGTFSSTGPETECLDSADEAVQRLKKLYCKYSNGRKTSSNYLRDVRYRVDVPAWTTEQRQRAGVPQQSPIHPLKGDRLDETRTIIPGIHTPYVYESAPHFGAVFQIHAEDFRLCSLNHLYKGRKIWIVLPCTAIDLAEEAFERGARCSQFMRHRAEFIFPDKLEKMGVPFRIVDQQPGETIVILPDAYHEGFSTGYTLAEAKNHAESTWNIDSYQPCAETCNINGMIPKEVMEPLGAGEERLDLWQFQREDERNPEEVPRSTKRTYDDDDTTKGRQVKRNKA